MINLLKRRWDDTFHFKINIKKIYMYTYHFITFSDQKRNEHENTTYMHHFIDDDDWGVQ